MANNKVIFNNNTLIDLTEDTVIANYLPSGITAHNASGEAITGTVPIYTKNDTGQFISTSADFNGIHLKIKPGFYNIDETDAIYTQAWYTGSINITPTKEKQTIFDGGLMASMDPLIVLPIPDQYPDVSSDTVTADTLLSGITAHNASGEAITGTVETQTFRTGTSEPDNSLGYDGDLYLVVEA